MSTIRTNYPLHWPEGWKRSPSRKQSNFDRNRTLAQARDFLLHELYLLGAPSGSEISSNVRVRGDGLPYSQQPQPDDRGVAVYFKLSGKDYVLACDRFNRVECNIYAIGKHVEAMRAQERYGVGSIEQSFRGYMALPTTGSVEARPWYVVLGVPEFATRPQILEAFRRLALAAHPDHGGTAEAMAELIKARDEGMAS